jgi:hypothetical protein
MHVNFLNVVWKIAEQTRVDATHGGAGFGDALQPEDDHKNWHRVAGGLK